MLDNARYGKQNEISRNFNDYSTEKQRQMNPESTDLESLNASSSYHHDNTQTDQSQASLWRHHDGTEPERSHASRQFVPRCNTEPVKNCTKLDKQLLDKIVQKVATELLSRSTPEDGIMKLEGNETETNKYWNKGGKFYEYTLVL